jgi:hypothetical protein
MNSSTTRKNKAPSLSLNWNPKLVTGFSDSNLNSNLEKIIKRFSKVKLVNQEWHLVKHVMIV